MKDWQVQTKSPIACDYALSLPILLEKAKLATEISDGKNEIPHTFLSCKI